MKVILNKCFGGFDVSQEAYELYAKKKGIKLFPYELEIKNDKPIYRKIDAGSSIFTTNFTKDFGDFVYLDDSIDEYLLYLNGSHREDPLLIEVVEELGEKANSQFSKLIIVDIPDGMEYEIDDYDGVETLHQKVEKWWRIMKNKDKYDLNTLKIEWSPQTFEKRLFTVKVKRDESIIFSKEMKPNETGSNAYNAWLEQEYKPPILDDVEKAYLSAVIKPFRKDIKYIKKIDFVIRAKECLLIKMRDLSTEWFPLFEKGTMYKGMEANREYTLEELGLWANT